MDVEIPLKFVEVDKVLSRLGLSKFRKRIAQVEAMADSPGQLGLGSVVIGTVQRLKPYGAFFDIGDMEGMLPVCAISHDRVSDISTVLQLGDTLKVMILWIDRERGRVGLSTKYLEPTPGDMIHNPKLVFEKAEEMAQKFWQRISRDSVMGMVQRLEPDGAIIDIGGMKGILPVSAISHDRVSDISTVLQPGDILKVMITLIDRERGLIGLATKFLEPTPGDMIRNPKLVFEKAEEMAPKFWQRIAQAEAMSRADMRVG